MNENSDAYRSDRSQLELQEILNGLVADWENEVVEFKSVGDSYSTSSIGKYVSALANEANLRNADRAWLIFGVNNKTRQIESSDYRCERERLDSLKHQISENTDPITSFREIHVLKSPLVLCSHSILGLGIGYSGINALQFASGVVESHLPIDGALFDADVICPCGCFVL